MAEPPIGRGFDFGRNNSRSNPVSSMSKFAAKVSVDGLTLLERALDKIARHTERIRTNMQAVNATGRQGGFWRNILGGQTGGGQMGGGNNSMSSWMPQIAGTQGQQGVPAGTTMGTPGASNWMSQLTRQAGPTSAVTPGVPGPAPVAGAAAAGTAGTTMPWLARMGAGALVANNVISNRFGRNVAESVPISAQNMLMSSMYSGLEYRDIEINRIQALGRYGGSRADMAQTQRMALEFGQTPQQATNYMQGVGVAVQAMGGTMTAPQVAQATGSFIDPQVLRRQQALGIPLARQGGQIRNLMEVGQDVIRNYEQRFNQGRKLNEMDMARLRTPGDPLRMMFQNFYLLDDTAMEIVVTAGSQTIQAGGTLSYATGAGVAGLGLDRNRLGLAAPSAQTGASTREAGFARAQEGAMVGRLHTEETFQEVLGNLEDATSAVTGAFHQLERVIKVVVGGLGLMGGVSMLGRGGGGMFGGGGGGMFGGGGGGGVGGGVANAAGGAGGMFGQAVRGAGLAIGTGLAVGGIQQAVNARSWGDMFGGAAKGTVGGAMAGAAIAGPPGAVAGTILGGGASAITGLYQVMHGQNVAATETESVDASHMTDRDIIDRLQQMFRSSGVSGGHNADWKTMRGGSNTEMRGMLDRFQVRRAALILDFMKAAETTDPDIFASYIKVIGEDRDNSPDEQMQEWADLEIQLTEIASGNRVDDDKYERAGEKFIELSRPFRWERNHIWPGYEPMNNLYKYFFGDIRRPMDLEPIDTEPAYAILDRYEVTAGEATEAVQSMVAAGTSQQGDPVDASSGGSTASVPNVDNMPMAEPPDDRTWGGLDPRMKKRLLALFYASKGQVTLGGGGGTRTEEEQRNLFLSRHTVDPNGPISWNGQHWRHTSGAAAAPPGRSMHEIGMAADLAGPGVGNGWLARNVARFGLKDFSNVNSEPWHVQLAEFPNSRREYEGVEDTGEENTEEVPQEEAPASSGMGGGGGPTGIGGSSLSLLGGAYSSLGGLTSGSLVGGGVSSGGTFQGTGGETTAAPVEQWTGGVLTGPQIAKMAYDAGFRGEGLVMAVAISKRESGWDPNAYNGNTSTGDQSYGLFQINMIGDLGPARRTEYGLSSNDELFNPTTNLRAAFKLSKNGTDFYHWGAYGGRSNTFNTNMGEARSIVQTAGLGDPVFDTGMDSGMMPATGGRIGQGLGSVAGSGGGGMGGGTGINVNVTIQSTGNYAYDAQQLAKAARPALEREYIEVSAKRGS